MSNSGLGSGFLPGYSGGILGMNMLQQPQLNANDVSNSCLNNTQSSMELKRGLENAKRIGVLEKKGCSSTQKGFTVSFGKEKRVCGVNNEMSDEDGPSLTEDNEGDTQGKRGSQWQRMKWTDNIVRLLIQSVAYVGDDVGSEGPEGLKRKSGCLQKKGKWKMVSNIMMGKGCVVSPQQCEDKFNDLNKRYKKLNDILGRGTCCAVVEKPALMDCMTQLSAKAKDTVKRILCSKQLFYKEMCAYHNGQKIPGCTDIDPQTVSPTAAVQCPKDNNLCSGGENDDSEDDGSGDEEINGAIKMGNFGNDSFRAEIDEFFKDPTKSKWEQKVWIKKQMLRLEEERICIEEEGFELEKRRFKWQKFRSEKERELEIQRLENERLILENERMVLQLKHKAHRVDLAMSRAPFKSSKLG